MRTFQTVLLAIFGFFILAGVIAIATLGKFGGDSETAASAVIWGTLPSEAVSQVIAQYNDANDNVLLAVTYRQFSPDSFDAELIDALASGAGPDAVIISHESLVLYEDKLYTVPFASISERLFRDTYTEGSEIFMNREGVLALPIVIDPLVLYWNRTLFNTARVANPPSYWDELIGLGEKLTRTDDSFNILQSVIALGEFDNINHAKEIISTLILQAGNPITLRDAGGRIGVIMGDDLGLPEAPADSALRFYTEFANPVKSVYSWNRSLPSSRNVFVRGDLGLYLGFASELLGLQEENPNLNFDIAAVPQVRDSSLATTYGRLYGIGIVKQSPNIAGAFRAVTLLASKDAEMLWAEEMGLPPARRDLLAIAPADPYASVFYNEALISSAFLDPDATLSDDIFKELVSNITSGRMPVSRAVSDASARLEQLFK
ncbi:MAG: extracellular solute-binding protein [Candidatus Pacebacteria bacterium]|nr:extracellular solute-binding protein [Candidatus Paceibacterota bacterium]